MHLHLDLVGGIAGDMFIAAMLDVFPQLEDELASQVRLAGFEDLVTLSCEAYNDGVLTGKKFNVAAAADASGHHHRHYSEIKSIIQNSQLDKQTQHISLAIFDIIAQAEAVIHDKSVEQVAFHEVGAWDSIADVICASYLIASSGVSSVSSSALPLGSGQVKTAHGMLPVPAPATALILQDFEFVDDGIAGERITPTGAAILKFLQPAATSQAKLLKQGFGFGSKKMPGISNVLRILLFEKNQTSTWQQHELQQLEFELDDQTAEEIAHALDRLRQHETVVDVVQYAVMGKKNRLATCIRILAQANEIEAVISSCFELTTTLGIRQSSVKRTVLHRQQATVEYADKQYRVKQSQRPTAITRKTEMDSFTQGESLAQQREIRRHIEFNDNIDEK